MKYVGSAIVLFTAFILSIIAAVMSVSGMIALFAAHAIVVGIMMSSLEFAKIVASGWLKFYWTDRTVPLIHKSYLIVATVILMLITSLGIYGYLSAGHLEQTAPLANVALQSSGLERQIEQKNGLIKRLEGRVALIDKNVESFITSNKAQSGLKASQTLKKEREGLQTQINAGYAEINALNDKLVPFKQQGNEVEAKLGPIKYVAALFGTKDSEAAVRFVIVMIMLVFDPLAIVLMISGLISLKRVDAGVEVWTGETEPDNFVDTLTEHKATIDPEIFEDPEVESIIQDTLMTETPVVVSDHLPILSAEEPVETVAVETDDIPAPYAVEDYVVEDEPSETPETVEEDEPTFEIVQNLTDPIVDEIEPELEETETETEADSEPSVEPAVDRHAYMAKEDHRERLIALLQSEPSFMNEVERIIEQIAAERVAEENERIRGGLLAPETNRTPGVDK